MQTPKKPRADFPLTPCGNGQWRKIVNGRPYYFGSWHDDAKGEAALKEWCERKDGIYAGLDHVSTASTSTAGMTVAELVKAYLSVRSKNVQAGKLSPDTFRDYADELNLFAKFIGPTAKASGLKPSHFSVYRLHMETRKLGPHATKRVLACVKAAINYAMDQEWMTPIRFGTGFKAPNTEPAAVSLDKLRAGKTDRTERVLGPKAVRRLMRATRTDSQWRAIILLLLNSAMNPAEIARLKWSEINMETGRLHRKRWKTGGLQECYLWKFTRRSLQALPRTGEYVFTREDGRLWVGSESKLVKSLDGDDVIGKVKRWNFVSRYFFKVAARSNLAGCSPYTLRRTASTVSSHCRDDNASRRMMGHALQGRDRSYKKGRFPLARLRRVAMTIYNRLFVKRPAKEQTKKAA